MQDREDRLPETYFRNHYSLEESYWWHQNRIVLALSLLKPLGLKEPSIMDLGCGPGGFLQHLAMEFNAKRAVGVDVSPTGLEFCEKKGLDIIGWDLCKTLVLEEEGFDLITAMDVLEHLGNERAFMKTVVKNLRKGGYLLASVPALPWLFSSWDRYAGHLRRYTKKTLALAIERKELEIKRLSYAFSYALVPAVFRRVLGGISSEEAFLFPWVPTSVNSFLKVLGRLEASFVRRSNLPVGLSIYVLAKKTGDIRPRMW